VFAVAGGGSQPTSHVYFYPASNEDSGGCLHITGYIDTMVTAYTYGHIDG